MQVNRGLYSYLRKMTGLSRGAARRVPKSVVVTMTAVVALAAGFGAAIAAPSVGAMVHATRTLPIGPTHVTGTFTPPPLVGPRALAPKIETEVGTHLTIVPTFESTVTSSSLSTQIESAFNYVVGQYEAEYSDPITIDVNVAYTGSGLGESDQALFCYSYSTVVDALEASETTPDQITSAQDVPATDPTGGSTWCLSLPELMAIGLLPANCFSSTCSADVPTITFGVQPYTFNPADRDVAGDYDFIGVAEHELSEVMGRIPGLDQSGFYTPNDLFRSTAPGTRNLTAYTPGAYFSINSGTTNLVPFNTVSGADAQDYASPTPDSFNAFASPGETDPLTTAGITNVDVLGYHRIATSLALTPSSSTTASGTPISLTADGSDSLGFAIGTVTGATTFTIAPDGSGSSVGAACTGSSCSATAPGLYKVTGTDGGATGSTTFSVSQGTPLTPTTPVISNLPASGTDGGGFTASVSTTGDGTTSVTSSTTSVCTASGLIVSYVGGGICTLTAHVTAGIDYAAANGTAQSFSVTKAPVFTSSATTTFVKGKSGTFTVSANGYPTAMTFAKTGSLPGGVTLTGAGVLSGKPTATGTFTVTITAANGVLPNAKQTFTLRVVAIKITTLSLGSAKIAIPYTLQLTELGGTSPFTWKNTTPKLPAGLSLSASGKITGKVKSTVATGAYSVGISVHDNASPTHHTATAVLKIIVT